MQPDASPSAAAETDAPSPADYEHLFLVLRHAPARRVHLDADWYRPSGPDRADPYFAPPGNWMMVGRLLDRLPASARPTCGRVAAELALDRWLADLPADANADGPNGRDDPSAVPRHPHQQALAGIREALAGLPESAPERYRRWNQPRPKDSADAVAEAVARCVRMAFLGSAEDAVAAGIESWPGPPREYLVRWWRRCCARLSMRLPQMELIDEPQIVIE